MKPQGGSGGEEGIEEWRLEMARLAFAMFAAAIALAQSASAGLPDVALPGLGKTVCEIPVPSRLVIVKGRVGTTIIRGGYLAFREDNKVEFQIEYGEMDPPGYAATYDLTYRISPISGVVTLFDRHARSEWGKVLPAGRGYLLRLHENLEDGSFQLKTE